MAGAISAVGASLQIPRSFYPSRRWPRSFLPCRKGVTVELPTSITTVSSGGCGSVFTNISRRASTIVFLGRPSGPQPHQQPDDASERTNFFTSPEELNYLWKLASGTLVGAAIVKYGCILFPEVTRPNILQALLMIGIPVVIGIILLILQSNPENQR